MYFVRWKHIKFYIIEPSLQIMRNLQKLHWEVSKVYIQMPVKFAYQLEQILKTLNCIESVYEVSEITSSKLQKIQ